MNKTKDLLVIPHGKSSSRVIKSLIELLAREKLEWQNRINNHFAWRSSQFTIDEYQVNVIVTDIIDKKQKSVWPEIAEKVNKADLVLYVFDSLLGMDFNDADVDIFFDRHFPTIAQSDEMMNKRFLVFAESEKTAAWWNSLTAEEKTWQNDNLMCCEMYGAINCNDNGDAFDCSYTTGKGIDELRNRMIEFFDENV